MFVSHLYVFLGKMSSSLAHFLIGSFIFLELSCRSCLYIYEINSLSVASFAIHLAYSFLCCAEAFNFNSVLFVVVVVVFFFFAFISNILGGGSQRILLLCMSESVLPMLTQSKNGPKN